MECAQGRIFGVDNRRPMGTSHPESGKGEGGGSQCEVPNTDSGVQAERTTRPRREGLLSRGGTMGGYNTVTSNSSVEEDRREQLTRL